MSLTMYQGSIEKEALWRPSLVTHAVITKAPEYAMIFRVCPEAGLDISDPEIRLCTFYKRMIDNQVAQGLMTKEDGMKRILINCSKLSDMPRKLPIVLKGRTEFEQACLLSDGELVPKLTISNY